MSSSSALVDVVGSSGARSKPDRTSGSDALRSRTDRGGPGSGGRPGRERVPAELTLPALPARQPADEQGREEGERGSLGLGPGPVLGSDRA